MTAYSRDDEARIRLQAQVRGWTRAGLIDAERGLRLQTELRTDLRRTNPMLRAVLALFTAIIVAAIAGFVVAVMHIQNDRSIAAWLGIVAVSALAAAESAIASGRLYRFGVEEALAAMAVGLSSLAVMLLVGSVRSPASGYDSATTMLPTLSFAAAASLGVWLRYGFTYAAVAAMALAAFVPFQMHLSEWSERTVSAAVLFGAFIIARGHHHRHGDDYPGDESGLLQAAAWLGVYFVLNVHITSEIAFGISQSSTTWFYWTTYGATWLMPAIGLWLGLRQKDRAFIVVNLVLSIATLATNKSYLGWPRYSWDPMILGALLIGTALLIRRWLASGRGEERYGFTAARILEGDRDVVTALGNVSAVWQPRGAPPAERPEPGFEGGRSGGGGASGSF